MGCKSSKEGGCVCLPRKRPTQADYYGQELTSLNERSEKNNVGSPKKNRQNCDQLREEPEEAAKEGEAEIARRLTEQAEALRVDHEALQKELQQSHDQEKASMMEELQASRAALQVQLDELNSQLGSFRKKMKLVEESVLNRDYKRHIEEYGSPGQFWEHELQSLHFVIEMKNERLHELEKKLQRLESVMERNLLLVEKRTTLQQDNEDLRVQIQNHVSLTKQLSEELQTMREALAREMHARQQLHREKEEVLYRVLSDKGLPSFQLSTAAAEVPLIAT